MRGSPLLSVGTAWNLPPFIASTTWLGSAWSDPPYLCLHLSTAEEACDNSLDLLGSDPNIEREQWAKQQYFTYWLL